MTMDIATLIIYVAIFIGLYAGIYFLLVFYQNSDVRVKRKKKMRKKPLVSIIVPAFNEEKVIEKTLSNLIDLDYPRKEIIVVDDGSTDDTFKIASKFKGVKVLRQSNKGKGAAINYGLQHAKGEYVFIVDADTFPSKNSIQDMLDEFDERTVCVIPTIKVKNESGFIAKVQSVEYSIMTFLRKTFDFLNALNVSPGAPIFKKEFFKKYGGFDEDNVTEDFEMGLRVVSKKYEIKHCLKAKAYTIVPETLGALFRQRIRWTYGFIYNLWSYRKLFSPKYSELGVFLLPLMVFSLVILPLLLFLFLFETSTNAMHMIRLISTVGMDTGYIAANIFPNIKIWYILPYEIVYFSVISIIIGIILYLFSLKITGDKFSKEYLVYSIFFFFFNGIVYTLSLLYFLLGKKPKW